VENHSIAKTTICRMGLPPLQTLTLACCVTAPLTRAPFPNFLALARAASPLSFVDALDPPTYIVQGTADLQVAIRQRECLRDTLNRAGLNTT
jgi:fermentation-respiration switch protein FrsA (DUF1100 family)